MADAGLVHYELWQDEDGLSFFPENSDSFRKLLSANARLIWSCEARSWHEAQALKHEHLGWEAYRPLP